jgi:expansin (peptidoglycan-binding protein)
VERVQRGERERRRRRLRLAGTATAGLIVIGTTITVIGRIASPGEPTGTSLVQQQAVATASTATDAIRSQAPTPGPTDSSPGPAAAAAGAATGIKGPRSPARPASRPAAAASSSGSWSTSSGTSSTSSDAGSAGGSGTGSIQFGPTYHGRGTFYAATGAGNCMFEATGDRLVAAMNHTDYANSQACGAYLAVTGPTGATVTVKIVDQCPECGRGDIDLSAEAFAKLAAPSTGRIPIAWRLLSPTLPGPVAYVYKSGSSQWWCAVQVRNHRNPIRTLEVRTGGGWRALPRQDYNYFLSASGAGCGADLRITNIYGNRVTDTGIAVRPDAVQPGRSQFGAPR